MPCMIIVHLTFWLHIDESSFLITHWWVFIPHGPSPILCHHGVLFLHQQPEVTLKTFYLWNDCFFLVSFEHPEGKCLWLCLWFHTQQLGVIKHCALTPSTGHYNSDISYNFSVSGKCILILTSKGPVPVKHAHGIKKMMRERSWVSSLALSFACKGVSFFKTSPFGPSSQRYAYAHLLLTSYLKTLLSDGMLKVNLTSPSLIQIHISVLSWALLLNQGKAILITGTEIFAIISHSEGK